MYFFGLIYIGPLGFPMHKATECIISSIKEYLDNNDNTNLKTIYLISQKNNVITAFRKQLDFIFQEATQKAKSGKSYFFIS